jgi:HSP20 family protein
MRYRRLSYRYAMVVHTGQSWPFGDRWPSDPLRLLAHARWQPDADSCETATTVELTVDLAGVGEEDFELQLFEDALVVEGRRQLPSCHGPRCATRLASPGPFRVELPLPCPIDPERVSRATIGPALHSLRKRAVP